MHCRPHAVAAGATEVADAASQVGLQAAAVLGATTTVATKMAATRTAAVAQTGRAATLAGRKAVGQRAGDGGGEGMVGGIKHIPGQFGKAQWRSVVILCVFSMI